MGTHRVTIWNEECELQADKMSKSVWRATGTYKGETYQTTDRTETTAVKRWIEWARYKGG